MKKKAKIQFKDPKDFGNFCVALMEHNVPFSLESYQLIVIDEANIACLSDKLNKQFESLKKDNSVIEIVTKSFLKKARDLFRKFTKRFESE